MADSKSKTLLIGCGGVGSIAAINLEASGQTEVSAVLRSNYAAVTRDGFTIKSCDHGTIEHWKPSKGPQMCTQPIAGMMMTIEKK
jgi:ketopantoate reductase